MWALVRLGGGIGLSGEIITPAVISVSSSAVVVAVVVVVEEEVVEVVVVEVVGAAVLVDSNEGSSTSPLKYIAMRGAIRGVNNQE